LCGITGFTHKHWVPPPERIRASTRTIVHRGPDQQGTWESSIFSFGATRLKIIDLTGGDQPIVNGDGSHGIVFNGEIYNHLELRRELEDLGHRFISHSDTETVLHAFLEWDTGCFARLRGMFALAVWDKSSRRLVLARDRMGIKPLYIFRVGEDLYFGSELKALFVHPEIPRNLSPEGLDCYLALNYVPSPWTLVDGIEKFPAGHWLEWNNGAVRSEAYWKLPYGVDQGITLDRAQQELDFLLKQSVQEHLISDVPLGVWLSGGLDSTTILHYAAELRGSPLKTFSISFRGHDFDESPYIARVIGRYQTDHTELDLNTGLDLPAAIEEFSYYSDEPSADSGALPVWFLSKLSKTQTTVALSGEGADELFGGYLTYRANRLATLARRGPRGVLRLASGMARLWPASDQKIGWEYKLKRFLEGLRMPPERAHVYWNGTFSDDEKERLTRLPMPGSLRRVISEISGLPGGQDGLAPFLWWDQKYYLNDDILVKSDRMSMAHAVEVRPAFLDHRIVEFAARLPAHLKIEGKTQKVVLRQLMKSKLPAAVFQHGKLGFDIPAHQWMRGPLREVMQAGLSWGITEYSELFDSQAVQDLVKSHLERKANVGYHLWGLLILFQWMKRWRIQLGAGETQKAFAPARVGSFISS
jgi:asparagine synthase (glutamine-hydrolysing)